MARKSTPQPLTLDDTVTTIADPFSRSPLSPTTPKSPRSPFSKFSSGRKLQKERDLDSSSISQSMQADSQPARSNPPPSQQNAPSLPPPAPPQPTEKQDRPAKGGFFSNYKASKSASRLQQNQQTTNQAQDVSMSRDSDHPGVGHVSSKDKPRSAESSQDRSTKRKPIPGPKSSDLSVDNQIETSASASQNKKNKPKPFAILNRTKSQRDDEDTKRSPTHELPSTNDQPPPQPLRNAPLDKKSKEMPSSIRQRSQDRRPGVARESSQGRENGRHQPSFSSTGHNFLSNLRGTAAKGAGALSKGLFGKSGRSGSTNEREAVIDDEHYIMKVLNLPLVEQARLTRISKRLENSRDKTEFWMPAFPWRAIDYLNYKGSEVEGLYRVPGSAHEIKKWQRRFDEEHDIDLFREPELYDINIIGSMLKSWLRELPEPIFPKASQDRVVREAPQAETVPDVMIEELSNLPPFNYYLLFAITCHLSLLLAHADKNKMGYHNLLICFQPCMKIDAYCFKFLVCQWRDCWKGCKTEDRYITEEYRLFEPQPPSSADGSIAVESLDERNLSSSDSNQPQATTSDKQRLDSGKQSKLPLSQSQGTIQSTTLQFKEERTPTRQELKRLSPIKPLSPMGL